MNTGLRKAWLSVGLTFALAILLLADPAGAQPSTTDRSTPSAAVPDTAPGNLPDVAPPTIESGPNEAELEDLATIAEQERSTLDRAIARYAWNDNFTVAVEEIRAVSGDLAEAAITEDGTAWVAFAEEVPVEAVGILARFTAAHPAVDLDVRTGAGFTEAAFEDAIVRVHTALYDTPGVMEAVTSYDRPARQIVTTVSFLPGVDPDLVSTLQTVSAARLADDGGQGIADVLTTRVVLQDAGLTRDESSSYHYGGEIITGCTSGFAVRRLSDSSRGIAFAEHCDGTIYDDGDVLTYRGAHNGTHGDMEWRYGPDYEADDFYSGNSTTTEVNRRDVSGYATSTEGQTLCFNGKTTHVHVRQVSVCSGSACNLVQMGNHSTDGGDSGGPWFFGNTAYGIHQGVHCDPFCPYDRSVFTKATRLDNGLGVVVATS